MNNAFPHTTRSWLYCIHGLDASLYASLTFLQSYSYRWHTSDRQHSKAHHRQPQPYTHQGLRLPHQSCRCHSQHFCWWKHLYNFVHLLFLDCFKWLSFRRWKAAHDIAHNCLYSLVLVVPIICSDYTMGAWYGSHLNLILYHLFYPYQ